MEQNDPVQKVTKRVDRVRIGHWIITYNPKPIPIRSHDWDALHDEYDGEDSDLHFTAGSLEQCEEEIFNRMRYEK